MGPLLQGKRRSRPSLNDLSRSPVQRVLPHAYRTLGDRRFYQKTSALRRPPFSGVPGCSVPCPRPFPAPARSLLPPAGRGGPGFEWRGGKMAAAPLSPRAAPLPPRPRSSAAAAPAHRGGPRRPAPPLPAALCSAPRPASTSPCAAAARQVPARRAQPFSPIPLPSLPALPSAVQRGGSGGEGSGAARGAAGLPAELLEGAGISRASPGAGPWPRGRRSSGRASPLPFPREGSGRSRGACLC